MHEYMTRAMVATQAFTYADIELQAGEEFMATPDDAGYLMRHGRARPIVDAPKAAEEPETETADQTATRRRGRPLKAPTGPTMPAEPVDPEDHEETISE